MLSHIAIISLFALEATAFWRLPCRQTLTLERIDPITHPGGVGEHVHAIHGGNKFSASATEAELLKSDCSSCQVKQDKSAYWTPALYFQDSAGNFNVVNQTGGMLVYYLQRGTDLKAFPPGFRMIAGDPQLRSFPYRQIEKSLWTTTDRTESALRQKAIGFNCLNYDEPANAALGLKAMPQNMNCKDGLRTEVFFPSCWNGKDLDSPDHREHMRYPSLVDDGECPEGFETRFISLFFETIWDVYAYAGQQGRFIFSTGDPTGYGYHGDFMNAWDQTTLQNAINQCTNPSGMVEDCPLFDLSTMSEMSQCTIRASIREAVVGPLKALPGCNSVQEGPGKASKGGCATDPKDNNGVVNTGKVSSTSSLPPSSASTPPVVYPTSSSKNTKKPDYTYSLEPIYPTPIYPIPSLSPSPASSSPTEKKKPLPTTTTSSDPYLVIVTVTSYYTAPAKTIIVQAPPPARSPVKRHVEQHLAGRGRHGRL